MPDHISYSEFQNEWISSTDVKQFNHIATTMSKDKNKFLYSEIFGDDYNGVYNDNKGV